MVMSASCAVVSYPAIFSGPRVVKSQLRSAPARSTPMDLGPRADRVGEPQTHARPALPGVGRAHHAEAALVGGLDTRALGELEHVDERPIARHGDLVPDREQVRVGGP